MHRHRTHPFAFRLRGIAGPTPSTRVRALALLPVLLILSCRTVADPAWPHPASASGIASPAHAIAPMPGSLAQFARALDINTADAATLAASLPGIGPVKAAAIVEHRRLNGGFGTVDDLEAVRGIGPKTLETLRPLVRVGPWTSGGRDVPRRLSVARLREHEAARRVRAAIHHAEVDAARALTDDRP